MAGNEFDVRDLPGAGITTENLNSLMREFGFPTRDRVGQTVLIRRSMTSVARVARDEMKKEVPVKTGQTRRSIIARSGTRRKPATVKIESPLWYLLEFGRRPGSYINKRGKRKKYPGAKPFPYIFPSLEDNSNQAKMQREFVVAFRRLLQQYAAGNPRIIKLLGRGI